MMPDAKRIGTCRPILDCTIYHIERVMVAQMDDKKPALERAGMGLGITESLLPLFACLGKLSRDEAVAGSEQFGHDENIVISEAR